MNYNFDFQFEQETFPLQWSFLPYWWVLVVVFVILGLFQVVLSGALESALEAVAVVPAELVVP